MAGREGRVGDDKSEPKFSEQERRAARARMDTAKEGVRSARASAPGDLYVLGMAARTLVDDPALSDKLGYASQKAMLDTELQGILGSLRPADRRGRPTEAGPMRAGRSSGGGPPSAGRLVEPTDLPSL